MLCRHFTSSSTRWRRTSRRHPFPRSCTISPSWPRLLCPLVLWSRTRWSHCHCTPPRTTTPTTTATRSSIAGNCVVAQSPTRIPAPAAVPVPPPAVNPRRTTWDSRGTHRYTSIMGSRVKSSTALRCWRTSTSVPSAERNTPHPPT